MLKHSSSTAIATILLLTAPSLAFAQGNLFGDMLRLGGAIIVNDAINRQQQQQTNQPAPRSSGGNQVSSNETRILRMEIQRRLNLLGLDAGVPDGVFGPRTRRAVSAFQNAIGTPATGAITESEIARLYQLTDGTVQQNVAPAAFPNAPVAAAAFPPIGGVAALGMTAPAPAAFPHLGAPAPGQPQAAAAFPQLGAAPGQPQVAGFPQLASPTTTQPQAAAFPTLGGAAAPQQPAAAGFPQLGAATEPASAAAFPELGGGAEQPAPAFPAVPGAVPDPVPDMVLLSGDVEARAASLLDGKSAADFGLAESVAGTAYAGDASHPEIFGIGLGDPLETSVAALAEAGFADCLPVEGQDATSCKRSAGDINETILLAGLPDGALWHVSRTIQFATPVDNALLVTQMRTPYPELVDAGRIAPESCTEEAFARASGSGWLTLASIADIATLQRSPDAIEATLNCPVAYELVLSGQTQSEMVAIAFTHGAAQLGRILEADEARRVAEEQKMVEITDGLQF